METTELLADKLFLVIYKDDLGITKTKKLYFKSQDNNLAVFYNRNKEIIEVINTQSIIRMQELR